MNDIHALLILVNSLTKAEKRYFHLYSNLQNGDKVYITLYKLIDSNISAEDLYTRFCQLQDGRNFKMATKHLYSIIMDCLVHLRKKENIQAMICNYITKADILFERELFEETFDELDKAKNLATIYENDPLLLLIHRTELKYLSSLGFKNICERDLVKKQMKINDIIKYTRNTNLHLQLYDILKHRITYKGDIRSNKQKDNLNDLVLSELNLIANNSYKGFEARKLHLLFQATYYLNTGNYKSAIRFYQELITLFESNQHLILNPPIYYLSALKGILDSLHLAGLYQEMLFFIDRLRKMQQGDYATEFLLEINASIYQYEQVSYINTGKFEIALELSGNYGDHLFKKIDLLRLETQLKLYLNTAILYLCLEKPERARKSMKKIFSSGKLFHTLPSYKTARLINLLILAELGDYSFFENEINSIKRNIHYEKHIYRTEKLLFRFVMSYPLPSYQKAQNKLWMQFQKEIAKIREDKYEKQLLKTFDILSWVESKLTNRPFAEILEENYIG